MKVRVKVRVSRCEDIEEKLLGLGLGLGLGKGLGLGLRLGLITC